jgi:hypothetical protein
LGAWADFASSWVGRFSPVVNGQPWHYPLLALLMYEPFALLFGIIGGASLVAQKQSPRILVWTTGGLLILALLAGGRDPGDVALVCAPLVLLAGRAVEDLVRNWQDRARLPRETLFVLVVLGILVYVALEASFYARSLYRNLPQSGQFLWFWLLAISLIVVLSGLSIAWFGLRLTWRVGGAVLVLVLLLVAFSGATGLNYRHANDPRELHILTASDAGVRDALEVMEDLSYHQRGQPRAAAVTAQADLGPIWHWYLREWEDVTFAKEMTAGTRSPLMLTAAEGDLPALGQDYIGQDFVVRTWWQPSELSYSDNLTWWLYRQSASQPIPIQRVILWMQAEEVASSE